MESNSKKEELKNIIDKYNRGYITTQEKDASIEKLLEAESEAIWSTLIAEYKEKNSVAEPGITHIHSWNDCSAWAVDFKCIDDGGLLQDADSIGKSFQIIRADGVKATLKIVKKYTKLQAEYENAIGRKAPFNGRDVYIAIGQIDDYYFSNSEPPRANMEIHVKDGINDIIMYSFHENGNDIYSIDFPRWKPYIEMMNNLKELHNAELQKQLQLMLMEKDIL